MLAKTICAALEGLNAVPVEVEAHSSGGLPSVTVVGLPDAAVKESRERVKSAIMNSGYRFPRGRLTVNLAPADIRKEGPVFDLAIALATLVAGGGADLVLAREYMVLGELALDGTLRPVRGALSAALAARDAGLAGLLVPPQSAPQAAVVEGVEVYAPKSLTEAVGFLSTKFDLPPVEVDVDEIMSRAAESELDLVDVKGQASAKRALTIAAAGGHNLLFIGPPGSGKSMLASRLPGIMPRMTLDESLEVTKVHSVASLLGAGEALVAVRPFRAPHHTASYAGLAGGGAGAALPGEVSLAHNGVLFLDELPEFDRRAREALRQPLELGEITVTRAGASTTYPSRIMLIAAMNPCPCGHRGDPRRECRCAPRQVEKYFGRVSGPLLERFDLQVEVPAVPYRELTGNDGEGSRAVRKRVQAARELQQRRLVGTACHSNAAMSEKLTRKLAAPEPPGEQLLRHAVERLGFSARAYSRVLKVARTIADLARSDDVKAEHISEAIQYRTLDRGGYD
jgi:magnesium chelatase family protein